MPSRCCSFLLVVALSTLAAGVCPARADDDAEKVGEKLSQAKKAYADETQKFRKAVGELLARRENDARRAGNKNLLDQIKAEQRAFEKSGELPAKLPTAFHNQIKLARVKLSRAYAIAIRDYVRLKADKAAEAAEKEQRQSLIDSALMFGRRTHLASLKPFNVQVWNKWFEKDTSKYKMDGAVVPHSIFMHPESRGEAAATYALAGKATVFRATIGVPVNDAAAVDPSSALTFEVLGDGKSLWKSEPVKTRNAFQTCTVVVEKVNKLTLRVQCPDSNGSAHAVWFTPIIVE